MPPRVCGIIFDLDGTLVDAFAGIAASLNDARRTLGMPPLPLAAVREHVGWGVDRLVAGCFGPEQRPAGRALYLEHHERHLLDAVSLLPGVDATLAALARQGIVLAVATNKPGNFARRILAHLAILERLALVIGGDEVGQPKPHPEMLDTAVRRLGLATGQVLYVGDMEVDVEAGRRAGLRVVGVATGVRSRAELARAGADPALAAMDGLLDVVGEGSRARRAGSVRADLGAGLPVKTGMLE